MVGATDHELQVAGLVDELMLKKREKDMEKSITMSLASFSSHMQLRQSRIRFQRLAVSVFSLPDV